MLRRSEMCALPKSPVRALLPFVLASAVLAPAPAAAQEDEVARAELLTRRAKLAHEAETDGEEHAEMARRAVEILEEEAPGTLALARALDVLSLYSTTLSEARAHAERALAIKEAAAPDSLEVAETLTRLEYLYPGAEGMEHARRALAIRRRLEPGSAGVAAALADVARHLRAVGDLPGATRLLEEALAIQEGIDPKAPEMASLLASRAILEWLQGDLRGAEALNLRALEIEEATAGPVTRARRLNNLGHLAYERGDLDTAERYLRRGLALLGEDPASDLRAASLSILADVALARDQVEEALALYHQAMVILRRIDAGHPGVGYVRSREARVLLDAGRGEEAREVLLPVVERAREEDPGTPALADRLFLLAEAERLEGRGAEATALHLEALAIREAVAPGSLDEAESAHALGVLARERGDREEALARFRQAVAALEEQSERLGGSPETQARFRGRYRAIYRDLERLLLDLERPDEAFQVLERSRAQGLLSLMATRRLDLDRDLPEDLGAELRAADAEYDRWVRELATSGPGGDATSREEIRRSLERAREGRQDVRARLRAAAPRTAAFRMPHALTAAEARASLPAGTLFLSYSLGLGTSRLYAAGPGDEGLAVFDLGAGEAAIRAEVEGYRRLIASPGGSRRRLTALAAAASLGNRLLGPVAGRLRRAERLLIVPDGALHLLPFAALADPAAPADRPRFLVEALPSHVVSSVTLYASLRRGETGEAPGRVVGFGDPSYPETASVEDSGDAVLRGALDEGLALTPLPSSRAELEALERTFPERAETWTGRSASEARVRTAAPGADVLHLACHGYVDERFPLESGLALAIEPGGAAAGDNGLLQAWEVFEDLRLEADLVTLSACATALGREDPGEGLLGLTWAFLYAGARSVVASLWSVSDASTAELMARFYRELSEGATKAEALRRAQLALLEDPAHASPFYWAPFHLVGDGG